MATYSYTDFRVEFTPRDDARYDVSVRSTGGPVVSVYEVPLSASELEQAVVGVARGGKVTRRAVAHPGGPGAAPSSEVLGRITRDVGANVRPELDAVALGGLLAKGLFTGDLASAYSVALAGANGPRQGVRLTLSLGAAPALLSIPWEFLYRDPVFLASQRHTPVVRQLASERRAPPPTIPDVVRILGVISSPKDLNPLQVATERARVETALKAVTDMGRVQLDWLEPATRRGLHQALRDGSYHVLHYVGHSAFEDDEGLLYLETDDGRADAVDSTLLANLLSDQRLLRLVVLNSCQGARTTLADPYAGVATTLIQLGVPAVVAMQFEISDDAAVLFAEELYTNLIARQFPIDAAVAEARKAMLAVLGNDEFATPVLFVQDPELALFEFAREAEALPATPPPGATGGRTLPDDKRAPLPSELPPEPSPAPKPVWQRPRVQAAAAAGLALFVGLLGIRACAPDAYQRAIANLPLPTTTTTLPDEPTEFTTYDVGSTGAAVEAAQHLLIEAGFPVPTTRVYDEATEAAMMDFEQARGLPVDGQLGPLTWDELVPVVRPDFDGNHARAAQILLNANGAGLSVDGIFGSRSTAAARAFETEHGLHVDGIVDDEVWKLLVAGAPVGPLVDVSATTTTTTALRRDTGSIDPSSPRPATGHLAFVVEEAKRTGLWTVDPDAPDVTTGGAATPKGTIDEHPSWQAGTNRLAFDRRVPEEGGEVGVFYVVPANGAGDGGKRVATLVTGRAGTERLPVWAADGTLFYVATTNCTPGAAGCEDSVRRATFLATNRLGEGPYAGDVVSLDSLRLNGDALAAGPFDRVSALAADPRRADSFAVVDAAGLSLVDAGVRRLLVADAAGVVTFTPDGERLVLTADDGHTLTLVARDGTTVASRGVAEMLLPTDAPNEATVAMLGTVGSLTTDASRNAVIGFLDDVSDGVPGVVLTLDTGGDAIAVADVTETPEAVSALGRILAVDR